MPGDGAGGALESGTVPFGMSPPRGRRGRAQPTCQPEPRLHGPIQEGPKSGSSACLSGPATGPEDSGRSQPRNLRKPHGPFRKPSRCQRSAAKAFEMKNAATISVAAFSFPLTQAHRERYIGRVLLDRSMPEQVAQVRRIDRVAEEREAVVWIDVEDFLHGAQERRMAELDRAGERLAVHVLVRVLGNDNEWDGELVGVPTLGLVPPEEDRGVFLVRLGRHDQR